ncbi:hypothetical protein GCM10023342_32030 [Modicisalibacter zincidurans]|uniref:Uncharacterized protein n=1 Tax=Modicisalibacter zincidurans TaxID=1178777 RepID=A0ABP9RMC5_9GAMM
MRDCSESPAVGSQRDVHATVRRRHMNGSGVAGVVKGWRQIKPSAVRRNTPALIVNSEAKVVITMMLADS